MPFNDNEGQPWQERVYDWASDGTLTYTGFHKSQGASQAADGWYVFRFTWDSNGNMTGRKGPRMGKWNDRASMGW